MKDKIIAAIDRIREELLGISDYILENPEVAFQEYKAVDCLTKQLESDGFIVEKGLGSLPTAFRATYEQGTGGPSIGLLCEYDALPGIGHACAHHMQGACMVGAAKAIKDAGISQPYKLVVYGTPAEEGGGGKITMLKEGYFRDIDLALMMHGGPATQTDVKSLAAATLEVTFQGKSAHAALKPDQGRSALDALLLTFQGVEFLREHVKEDTRMHYTVLNAGGPANVVPEKAVGSFSLRSYNSDYLKTVMQRFEKIVEGASLMTETSSMIDCKKTLESKVPVHLLNDILMKNAEGIDAPVRRPSREKTGSTDFGNVTYELPGACIRIAFVDENVSSHSQEFLDGAKTERGRDAVIIAAKIVALTVYDLIENNDYVTGIKDEFQNAKAAMQKQR